MRIVTLLEGNETVFQNTSLLTWGAVSHLMAFSSTVMNDFKDIRTGDTNVKEFSEIL